MAGGGGLGQFRRPGSPGSQYVIVKVSVRYTAGGSGNSQSVVNQMNAVGAHKAVYQGQGVCKGNFEFGDGGVSVFSGQSAAGYVCFEIASNDRSTLKMFVYPPGSPVFSLPTSRVWFAPRR